MEIELGDTVKDIHSGFTGVAINKTEFINGCVQYGVVAKCVKNEEPKDIQVDGESLVVTKKGRKHKKDSNGGPMRKAPVQRGY